MTRSKLLKAAVTVSAAFLLTIFLLSNAALSPRAFAQASTGKQIYPAISAAPADITTALAEARKTHKRVILDFGGDWCGDCQVLNIYFQRSPNAEIIAKNFIVVKVNIGHEDANLDIAQKYGVPLSKGVPGLSVVEGNGTVVYAQKGGEFEDMRHMQSSDLTDFLNKWKP